MFLPMSGYRGMLCRRCRGYKGGCAIHQRSLQKEVPRYFRQQLYTESFDEDDDEKEWLSTQDDADLLEANLAYHMTVFCHEYGAPQHGEEGGNVVVKNGKLDVAFRAEDFIMDNRDPHSHTMGNEFSILATDSGQYFTMDAIASFNIWDDDFCCLFEDGTYFLRDSFGTCNGGYVAESFASKLLRLREKIVASHDDDTVVIDNGRPLRKPCT